MCVPVYRSNQIPIIYEDSTEDIPVRFENNPTKKVNSNSNIREEDVENRGILKQLFCID